MDHGLRPDHPARAIRKFSDNKRQRLARRTAKPDDRQAGRKTGGMRPLSHAACDRRRSVRRLGKTALVFPGSKSSGAMLGFKKFARRIPTAGGRPADVSRYALHSFISLAADPGLSEPTVAALVGHKGQSIAARYTHFAHAPLFAAADAAANRNAELMNDTLPPYKTPERAQPAGG